MDEDEKIEKRYIILLYVCIIVVLVAMIISCMVYSPKIVIPSFSIAESEISEDSSDDESVFPIEINFATAEELQLIPSIGPATAKLIIDYRDEFGSIVAFRELLSIDGIGEKTIEVLKEYCIIT